MGERREKGRIWGQRKEQSIGTERVIEKRGEESDRDTERNVTE